MVSTSIVEGIILIGALVVAGALIAAVLSKSGTIQSAFSISTGATMDSLLTKVKTVYATNSTAMQIDAWIKNVGQRVIPDVEKSDVYFGNVNSMSFIPYGTSGPGPRWEYSFVSSGAQLWEPSDTIHVEITLNSTLSEPATYQFVFITSNGVSSGDYIFSTG